MSSQAFLAALDSGSVSLRYSLFSRSGDCLDHRTVLHEGKLAECFAAIIGEWEKAGISEVVVTTDVPVSLTERCPFPVHRVDARLALIEGARTACPGLRTILHVGAERFFLLRFDEKGRYLDLKSNSSCAAGTGGFLDQQARRLSLDDSAELGERAAASRGDAPRIASRCSVFAKTDLIHAQQEGYTLDQICDGLCRGLVATICDSVLVDPPVSPIVFSGGVSLNRGVLRAMEERLGTEVIVPERPGYLPVLGAARLWLAETGNTAGHPAAVKSRRQERLSARYRNRRRETPAGGQAVYHPPLELRFSDYPDFGSPEAYRDRPDRSAKTTLVEVDRYGDFPEGVLRAWLGIDIGSTSTKAVLLDESGDPLAGFYTRTAGQPLDAVRALFQSAETLAGRHGTALEILGAATTGSGRKFVGSIIGADLVLDEISAHARAAVRLNPKIDTIIEIGGQDAKFTTMRNGVVTFSRMNTVCAAGTGSFIEEQSLKLGVPLEEYADRALGIRAPKASDRCTVFMERDINHYLSRGCTTGEILAAVLFSVRENYLLKVAETGVIGDHVCFQGATARNKALVAAFEEKLQKPVFVSRYCHLTGAIGSALSLMEEKSLIRDHGKTRFRGLDLYRTEIPMETEVCELCRNNCRIRVVTVGGDKVAFGFLCGRDYDTKRFVAKTGASAFTRAREKALEVSRPKTRRPSIGYPFALQGVEELPLWKRFFQELDIPFVSSEALTGAIALGKKGSGAEFCAPVTAFHGHVGSLCGKADFLFLPVYIEKKETDRKDRVRKFCYYTQYSSSLGGLMLDKLENPPKIISPLFRDRADTQQVKNELWKAMEGAYGDHVTQAEVFKAHDTANLYFELYKENLAAGFVLPEKGKIAVALLGRPYTVLPATMNKAIPELFCALDVPLYYQDMLPPQTGPDPEMEALLDQIHWSHAAQILKSAAFCAATEGLYPVFVTSFKCSPDSFVQEYLTRILDRAGKPYLILQLDEHDSNVGYETRIEAAVRSFRNHRALGSRMAAGEPLPVTPRFAESMKDKTVLMPAWDPVAIRLLAASLRHAGYDARALEETPDLVNEGLKTNTGQCIPLNVIAYEFTDYIRRHNLDPAGTVLWMIKSDWSCNIGMYPSFIRSLLEKEGGGMEKAGVYVGELSMIELGPMVTGRAYFAYLYAGLIHRLACRIRPYEVNPGQTDDAIKQAVRIFEAALAGQSGLKKAARAVGRLFTAIPRDESGGRRPKVAIFGDLYLRDNPVMNQDLVKAIEAAGGEVVVIAYTEYTKIVCSGHFLHWIREQRYREFLFFRALIGALELLEGIFQDSSSALAGPTIRYEGGDISPYLSPFHVRPEHEGETYENLLKVNRLVKTYPDLSLFVHTSPAFCCPSLVTEALASRIEEVTGIPVVNIIYDGTSAYRNDILAPYLKYPRGRVQ